MVEARTSGEGVVEHNAKFINKCRTPWRLMPLARIHHDNLIEITWQILADNLIGVLHTLWVIIYTTYLLRLIKFAF